MRVVTDDEPHLAWTGMAEVRGCDGVRYEGSLSLFAKEQNGRNNGDLGRCMQGPHLSTQLDHMRVLPPTRLHEFKLSVKF